MIEDRKVVEQAIEWARHEDSALRGQWVQPRPPSVYTLLADAAEKWLATQPKPEWKVRVWRHGGDVFELRAFDTALEALMDANVLLDGGARKVEIEKP